MNDQTGIVSFENYRDGKEIEDMYDLSLYLLTEFFDTNIPIPLSQFNTNKIIELSQQMNSFKDVDLYEPENLKNITHLWFMFINYVLPNMMLDIGLSRFLQHYHRIIIDEYTLKELSIILIPYPFKQKQPLCSITGTVYLSKKITVFEKQFHNSLKIDLKDKNMKNGLHYQKAMNVLIKNHKSYAQKYDRTYAVRSVTDGCLFAASMVDCNLSACPAVIMTTVEPWPDVFNMNIVTDKEY